jgi:hypothetical protein
MPTRNLGKMGEQTLGLWAGQRGIIANKADQDEAGWDFRLDFPLPDYATEQIQLPFDREPFPLQCAIQVKATDGRAGKKSVKLDNWLRMVKNPLPTFFLVLEFDGQDTCQRAFLVHIGEHYIASTLGRLRKASAEGRTDLHKMEMQFTYGADDALATLDGYGLGQAIWKHVGERPEEYAQRKINLTQSVGYDELSHTFTFKLNLPVTNIEDAYDHLVDFHLGLIPSIEMSNLEIRDERFGIPSPEPIEAIEESGRLEIAKHESIGTATVKLRTIDGKAQSRSLAETYIARGLNRVVSKEFLKVRFALPFVDLVVGLYDANKFSLKLNPPEFDKPLNLKQIQPLADITAVLDYAYQQQMAVEMEILYGEDVFREGQITPASTLSPPTITLLQALRNVWIIAKYVDIHDDAEVIAMEVWRQQGMISLVASALSTHRLPVNVTYWSTEEPPAEQICMPSASYMFIGQYGLAAAVAVIGMAKPTGQMREGERGYSIETKNIRPCRIGVNKRSEGAPATIAELTQAVIDEYQDEMPVLILANIHDEYLQITRKAAESE